MKNLIKTIIAFFEYYGEIILNNNETPLERINRTCGSDFFM